MDALGPKMGRPGGHIFYIRLYREKHWKIFLSETIRLRALIFGHILASPSGPLQSLFKLCPWGQNNPAPGSPETWSAFYRYLYVSFKQNSSGCLRATWPSCFKLAFENFSRRQNQRTLVVIGALRAKVYLFTIRNQKTNLKILSADEEHWCRL